MSHPHLSDDRLIEICFDLDLTTTDRDHLLACRTCESRRARLAGTIDEVDTVLTCEADEAFPAERLARQRARILQRIDPDGRPGRVITFPASHVHENVPVRAQWPRRWATVAAAIAASFVVGLVAEHLAHDIPGRRQAMPAARIAGQPSTPNTPIRPTVSDDEFLGQVELAAGRVGPVALIPLDALTPSAWDAR